MEWTPDLRQQLETLWENKAKPQNIRKIMGLTKGQLNGRIRVYNLHRHSDQKNELRDTHPAVVAGRTLFPSRVETGRTILKPGHHSTKLGSVVTKGRWRNMPIYALTLEERATCPRDCAVYNSCYGNNMQWAKRSPHGPEFEVALWRELYALNRKHRKGFVVRLHVLGDFYSSSYVDLWGAALDRFENLNVFGYTARQGSSHIGKMIQVLRDRHWERFSVRTSGAQKGIRTLVIDKIEDCPPNAIVCPAQTGHTRSCSACGFCWHSKRPVAFLRH